METKELFENFPKDLIKDLPISRFEGRIFVITTEQESERAVKYLMQQSILGFDTETRPSFKKWHRYKVSLLQICSVDTCFLFRLHLTGITPGIKNLLEDTHITKVGLSLRDDFRQLHERSIFAAGTFIDLQDMVRELGVADASLQKIYANLFRAKISKSQQLSNWEADILSEAQKLYAATDAWACIQIYNEIHSLLQNNNYKII